MAVKGQAVRAIIQCRLGSSRLPGKGLLTLAGRAAVVLCAQRAANRGAQVVVATSTEPADDAVATAVTAAGFAVVRGSEDDVLGRLVQAVADLSDAEIVVRLTADNLIPDGWLLEEMTETFQKNAVDYVAPQFPQDGLPYGVVAEVTTAGALRQAAEHSTETADREHVTGWISRHLRTRGFQSARVQPAWQGLRATMDYWEDFERMSRVFARVKDPVAAPWWELCEILAAETPPWSQGQSRLVLGLANLGLPAYGRVNRHKNRPRAERLQVVRSAVRIGVRALDGARAYGEAESLAGEILRNAPVEMVTKLDPLDQMPSTASPAEVRTAVEASVWRSCAELGLKSLPVLLLHRAEHLTSHHGAVWRELQRLQAEGVVGELGVSVYTPEEAQRALAEPVVRHVQLPFNLLDQRWAFARVPEQIRARGNVRIAVRSIFLQGLLTADETAWPSLPGVDAREWVARMERAAAALRRKNRADLCLAYGRAQDWVNDIVLGIETLEQLQELRAAWETPALTVAECRELEKSLAGAPEILLNPSLWPHE